VPKGLTFQAATVEGIASVDAGLDTLIGMPHGFVTNIADSTPLRGSLKTWTRRTPASWTVGLPWPNRALLTRRRLAASASRH
jgi:hypothetical protein